MSFRKFSKFLFFVFFLCNNSWASIFDLPYFLEADKWSFGLEPQLITSTPTGANLDFKPRLGINSILNLEGILGIGSGSQAFHTGLIADFDWFPDTDSQPGLATPIFLKYGKISGAGTLTYGLEPLLYKSFRSEGGGNFTIFVSVPFGLNYASSGDNSGNKAFSQIVLGTMFKMTDIQSFRFSFEGGFNLNQSTSYISGGATFYP